MKSTTYGDGFQGRIRPAKRAWLLCENLAYLPELGHSNVRFSQRRKGPQRRKDSFNFTTHVLSLLDRGTAPVLASPRTRHTRGPDCAPLQHGIGQVHDRPW